MAWAPRWKYPHNLNFKFSDNFFADWTPEDDINVGLPYPIHPPFKTCHIDVIKEFPFKNKLYRQEMIMAKRQYNRFENKIRDQDYSSSKYINLFDGILRLHDRDEWESPLQCDHNPYYRGFLDGFHIGGTNFLIRPDVDYELCVTATNSRKTFNLNLAEPFRSPIYSLQTAPYHSEVLLNVCQLSKVRILLLNDLDKQVDTKWTKKFKKPILDSKLFRSNLGVVSKTLDFVVYDLPQDEVLFDSTTAKIGGLIKMDWINDQLLGLMSQKTLKFLDSRSMKGATFYPTEFVNSDSKCDTFCNFKIVGNTIYGITRHSIVRSDLRNMKEFEQGAHLLRSEPCYFDFIKRQKETLCLANQNSFDDKILFTGNTISGLPLKVPSLYNTLKLCKLKGNCPQIERLDERLNYSTAGIKLLNENNEVALYATNYLGELFKQDFNIVEENQPVEILTKWIRKLPNKKPILHLNDVLNVSSIRQFLHSLGEDEEQTQETPSDDEIGGEAPTFFTNLYAKYRTDNLGEMGAGFASIWDDLADEEERMDDYAPQVNPSDKVNSWIRSMDADNIDDFTF